MPKKTLKYSVLVNESEKQLRNLNQFRNIIEHSDFVRKKESTEAEVRLAGLKDYYEMRKGWGNFLKFCLFIILIFNILLVFLVGKNWLTFSDEWFLRIVLTTNLADIIGLVYLVVRFLFSDQIEKESQKPMKT